MGAQWLERSDLRFGFKVNLVLGIEFVFGRDQDDVAGLAQAQALGLQDDVERLIPWHILEAQGHVAGHGVASDHVEVGEVCNHLEQSANFNILEVE